MFAWTEETEKRLKIDWLNGVDAILIAEDLGTTKNSVIGKAHRLGLPHHPKHSSRQKNGEYVERVRVPKPLKSVPKKKEIQAMLPIVEPSPNPEDWIPFFDLSPATCRAILGNSPEDGLALFCNNPADGTYCPYHNSKFYNPDYRK